jgi:hypothetical protein
MLWHPCEFDPRVKPERGTYELDRDHPLSRSILALWVFDESAGTRAFDLAAPGSGALTGGAYWRPGGLGFNGSTAYVLVSNRDALNPTTITVAARVRADGPGGSNNGYVLNKNYNGSVVPYSLNVGGAVSQKGMAFYDGSWRASNIATDVRGDGAWHTVAGTYDGAALRYWVDGRPDSSLTYAATLPAANTQDVSIGRYATDAAYFAGAMEWVRLYARALSASEVAWLAAEPYAMLRPLVRRVYSAGTAVAASYFRRTAFLRAGSRGAWN